LLTSKQNLFLSEIHLLLLVISNSNHTQIHNICQEHYGIQSIILLIKEDHGHARFSVTYEKKLLIWGPIDCITQLFRERQVLRSSFYVLSNASYNCHTISNCYNFVGYFKSVFHPTHLGYMLDFLLAHSCISTLQPLRQEKSHW